MINRITRYAATIVIALSAHWCAAQPNENPLTVDRLITDLDSPRYGTRERAHKELLALKDAALEPVKDALNRLPRSVEHRRRLEGILRELKLHARTGETEGGLRLRLNASNDTLGIGDQMTLISTLSNESKNALFIRIGWKAERSFLSHGPALNGMTDQLYSPERPILDGYYKPSFITLRPGAFVSITTLVTRKRISGQKHVLELSSEAKVARLELPAAETLRLRMIHAVELDEATVGAFARERAFDGFKGKTLLWSGSVRSDDIDLRLPGNSD